MIYIEHDVNETAAKLAGVQQALRAEAVRGAAAAQLDLKTNHLDQGFSNVLEIRHGTADWYAVMTDPDVPGVNPSAAWAIEAGTRVLHGAFGL